MLFNINTLKWDKELLKIFDIPENILPKVLSNSDDYGKTSSKLFSKQLPITGVAGDQQASLFGQMCIKKGMTKNTYGTGCFIMKNIGNKPILSKNKLLTTIAWKLNKETTYAFEGSVFVGGAVVQWLRDELNIIRTSKAVENLLAKTEDNANVYFVPAFAGIGAPYWNQEATGTITGLTRGTGKAHIARAAVESIAYQTYDVIKAMEKDTKIPIKHLRVDGGASDNNFLMQFQADILNTKIEKPTNTESTSMGAAFFAGLYTGFWKNIDEIKDIRKTDKEFSPNMKTEDANKLIDGWHKAIKKL
jgi:glycerol kinase